MMIAFLHANPRAFSFLSSVYGSYFTFYRIYHIIERVRGGERKAASSENDGGIVRRREDE